MSPRTAGHVRLRDLAGQDWFDLASALVASARDAIVAKTLAGTIVLWNAGAERLFGYCAAEAVGQPISLIVPPGLQAEHEEIMRRIAAGEGVEPFDTVRQHRSGALISVSIAVSPIRDADGRLVGASKIARDITEQTHAKQRAVRQMATEQSARERAEAASRGKDEFLAMLGHELRNPLAAIASAARVLELIGSADPTFAQAQQIIERQVTHAARVIADVLDVTRVTAGKVLLTPRPVQLGESVAQCIDVLASAGRIRNHRFSFAAEAEVWTNADPVRLQQIVTNLLDNAVKYTPAGGAIDVRVWAEDSEVVVRVEDSGIGIPGDLLPRVFDLFVQGERPAGMNGDGLGVGLPLVRSLAELHGGRVQVTSPGAGHGSVFTVHLPRISPPPPAPSWKPDQGRGRAMIHRQRASPSGERAGSGPLPS